MLSAKFFAVYRWLYVIFSKSGFYIVDHLSNFLFFRHRANQQSISIFSHDIVFKAHSDNHFIAFNSENSATAIVAYQFAILGDIAFYVFWRCLIKSLPCAEVTPSEIDSFAIRLISAHFSTFQYISAHFARLYPSSSSKAVKPSPTLKDKKPTRIQ